MCFGPSFSCLNNISLLKITLRVATFVATGTLEISLHRFDFASSFGASLYKDLALPVVCCSCLRLVSPTGRVNHVRINKEEEVINMALKSVKDIFHFFEEA